ncbi:MAG: hypothetical protein AAF696_26965 [Bacteroidota bacterium]
MLLAYLCVSMLSCKSSKKAYEKGNYESAVFQAIEKLRKSPSNKKSAETLTAAYPALKEYLLEGAKMAESSSNPLKWEEVMQAYDVLNRASDEIRRAPGARRIITNPASFQLEFEEAKLKAAHKRFSLGKTEMENYGRSGDRLMARKAYHHFHKVLQFNTAHPGAQKAMETAMEEATVWIEIQPIPMHSRSLALSNEFFENQISSFIRDFKTSPFTQFITSSEQSRSRTDADQIIQMRFDDFVVGQVGIKEKIVQRKKDSVIVGETKVQGDSLAPVYGSVEAEVHQFQKLVNSSGLLDLKILDARSGEVLSQQKFPGSFVYYDYWGFFNGDERATTEEDAQYLKKRQALADPLPQDLFIEFTRPIFDRLTAYVADFYKDY